MGVIWPSQALPLQPPNCLLVASTHLSKTTSRLHCIGHQFVSFVLILIMRVSVRCPSPPFSDGQGAILFPRLYRSHSAHGVGGRGIWSCLWRSVPPRGSGSVSRVTSHASCPPQLTPNHWPPAHLCLPGRRTQPPGKPRVVWSGGHWMGRCSHWGSARARAWGLRHSLCSPSSSDHENPPESLSEHRTL